MSLNQHKTGLALGAFFGLVHLGWAILVAIGVADALFNWIYRIHFIQSGDSVASFSFVNALLLVIFTTITGYVFGWVFATVWNKLYR